jgi:anthranilate phosphoribosyltransferase
MASPCGLASQTESRPFTFTRLKELIQQLRANIDLTANDVEKAARFLADGQHSEEEKAEFLAALRDKGETGEEVGYFAEAFLRLAIKPSTDFQGKPSIDLCGTGGDRLDLINVSTTAMFIVAAGGAVVVKHGNRAFTSRSGGADVLERLGIPVTGSPQRMIAAIEQTGIGFLFAPLYHPAFQAVAGVRQKLAEQGVATVFNLLGPLLNPLRPEFQLIGVFSPTILEKYALALARLGRRRAWVVHGEVPNGSGMDEVSTLGETAVHEVKYSSFNYFHLFPDQLGLRIPSLHELRGGDVEHNSQNLIAIISGSERGPKRDFVLINAAAALVVAGLAPRMDKGIQVAADLIDSGQALAKLRELQQAFGVGEELLAR